MQKSLKKSETEKKIIKAVAIVGGVVAFSGGVVLGYQLNKWWYFIMKKWYFILIKKVDVNKINAAAYNPRKDLKPQDKEYNEIKQRHLMERMEAFANEEED